MFDSATMTAESHFSSTFHRQGRSSGEKTNSPDSSMSCAVCRDAEAGIGRIKLTVTDTKKRITFA